MTKRVMLLVAIMGLAACSAGSRSSTGLPQGLPEGTLAIAHGGTPALRLHVQIAETVEDRARGLMGVTKLSDGDGMAFVFDAAVTEPFWMKKTLIPLDIAFWDRQRRIVTVLTMTPCKADPCTLYRPTAEYVGSVEMNKGLLDKAGIKVGDTVELTG